MPKKTTRKQTRHPLFSKNPLDFEIHFFEQVANQIPDSIEVLIPLAEAYTRRGDYKKGLKIDKRLAQLRKTDPIIHYNLACSYALTKNTDRAIQMLQKSIKLGYHDFEHLRKDKDLQNIHTDPRFETLLRQIPNSRTNHTNQPNS